MEKCKSLKQQFALKHGPKTAYALAFLKIAKRGNGIWYGILRQCD
jgi:hypothetical protein